MFRVNFDSLSRLVWHRVIMSLSYKRRCYALWSSCSCLHWLWVTTAPNNAGPVEDRKKTSVCNVYQGSCFMMGCVWVRPMSEWSAAVYTCFKRIVSEGVYTMWTDIDECGTELDKCPSDTFCLNTYSSYECRSKYNQHFLLVNIIFFVMLFWEACGCFMMVLCILF